MSLLQAQMLEMFLSFFFFCFLPCISERSVILRGYNYLWQIETAFLRKKKKVSKSQPLPTPSPTEQNFSGLVLHHCILHPPQKKKKKKNKKKNMKHPGTAHASNFNLLKTSPKYTWAGVYGKCMLLENRIVFNGWKHTLWKGYSPIDRGSFRPIIEKGPIDRRSDLPRFR